MPINSNNIVTIPQLPALSGSLSGSDLLPVWQNNDMRQASVGALLAAASTAGFSIAADSSLAPGDIGKLVCLNSSGKAFVSTPSGALAKAKGVWQISTTGGLTAPDPAIFRFTFSSSPAINDGDMLELSGKFHFVNTVMSPGDVAIGSTLEDTVANFLAAANDPGNAALANGNTVRAVTGDALSVDFVLDHSSYLGAAGNSFVATVPPFVTYSQIQTGVDNAAKLLNKSPFNIKIQGNSINSPGWNQILQNGATTTGTFVHLNGYYFPTDAAALLELIDRSLVSQFAGNTVLSYDPTAHTLSEINFPPHNPDAVINSDYSSFVNLNDSVGGTGDNNIAVSETVTSTPDRPDMITETVLGKLIALNGSTAQVEDAWTQNLTLAANQGSLAIGDQLIITANGELKKMADSEGEFITPSFMLRGLHLLLQTVSPSTLPQPVVVRLGVQVNNNNN